MSSPEDKIKHLARKCARSGLGLRDSRALFDALYRADALMLEGGSMVAAAKRAGVRPPCMFRQRAQQEIDT